MQPKYSKIHVQLYDQAPQREWDISDGAIDALNDAVPNASSDFDLEALSTTFATTMDPRKPINWIEHMHDRNITARHELNAVIEQDCRVGGGRWRLFDNLPVYASPWEMMSMDDVSNEHWGKESPLREWLKHICHRYEGEVALAWSRWQWNDGPLPREKVLWHPQFAKSDAQRKALSSFAARWPLAPDEPRFHETVDLESCCNTMIFQIRKGVVGHWRLKGGVITLMELFETFGAWYTAKELFFWYWHAQKVAKKRAHAWGSKDVRDAAQARFSAYGYYGHGGAAAAKKRSQREQ